MVLLASYFGWFKNRYMIRLQVLSIFAIMEEFK